MFTKITNQLRFVYTVGLIFSGSTIFCAETALAKVCACIYQTSSQNPNARGEQPTETMTIQSFPPIPVERSADCKQVCTAHIPHGFQVANSISGATEKIANHLIEGEMNKIFNVIMTPIQ